MKRTLALLLTVALLLITAHRLPAPISESPENPTPAPEQSAKPKTKRTVKPKANENSRSSTKRKTPTPTPENRNPFDGTWIGTFLAIPFYGNVECTIIITGTGTVLTSKSAAFGTRTYKSICDGTSVKWTDGPSHAALTPTSDSRTAIVALDNGGGFFGIGAYSSSVIFRRVSP